MRSKHSTVSLKHSDGDIDRGRLCGQREVKNMVFWGKTFLTKKEKKKKIFNVQLEKMHYILKKVNVCPRGKKEKRKIFMQCISNIDICSKQTIKVSAPISTGINNKHVMSDNPPCMQGNLGCGQREKKTINTARYYVTTLLMGKASLSLCHVNWLNISVLHLESQPSYFLLSKAWGNFFHLIGKDKDCFTTVLHCPLKAANSKGKSSSMKFCQLYHNLYGAQPRPDQRDISKAGKIIHSIATLWIKVWLCLPEWSCSVLLLHFYSMSSIYKMWKWLSAKIN